MIKTNAIIGALIVTSLSACVTTSQQSSKEIKLGDVAIKYRDLSSEQDNEITHQDTNNAFYTTNHSGNIQLRKPLIIDQDSTSLESAIYSDTESSYLVSVKDGLTEFDKLLFDELIKSDLANLNLVGSDYDTQYIESYIVGKGFPSHLITREINDNQVETLVVAAGAMH